MNRAIGAAFSLFFVATGSAGVADHGQSTLIDGRDPVAFHPQRVLVRFSKDLSRQGVQTLLAKVGAKGIEHEYSAVPGLMCVGVQGGTVDWTIQMLQQEPGVMYAERDPYRSALAQETPYGVPMVQAPQVWTTTRGAGAVVAVLDTGVDLGHPDLPPVVAMETFIPGEAVDDLHSHGTHCSGTVLAVDNDIGVVGVAPEASLMIGKVLGNGGSGATSGVMAGVQWAYDNFADVVSMSLGGGAPSQAEADLYQAVTDGGTLIVAAAGNSNSSNPSYPGSYEPVVNVAAVDSSMARAGFSNFGPTVDVSGPGVGVLSSIPLIDSTVQWDGVTRDANPLTGSALGTQTAQVYSCGLGLVAEDFPPQVAGNIAHIRRGSATFASKTQLALDAGAVAVVISNNVGGNFTGTLQAGFPIVVVGIAGEDGDLLQTLDGTQVTVTNGSVGHGYAYYSGTSMATPHVAGVAALLCGSRKPGHVRPQDLRAALQAGVMDLGDPGRDDLFGYGLVQSQDALQWMDDNQICPADWDLSGGVDGDDVIAFFADWDLSQADFDRSGGTDGDDVIAFFQRWDLSC